MKKLILSTALAATLGGAAFLPLPAMADTIIVRMAPPAPRHEVVPAPRDGYAWVPRWRFNRGGWMHGERADRVMHDRDGDGVPNRADRDRDGDGVPNRADARPNNPNRQ